MLPMQKLSPRTTDSPRVLSLLPGRVRVHLPNWSGEVPELEAALAQLKGVKAARANTLTGNVLVQFDPGKVSADQLIRQLTSYAAAHTRNSWPSPAEPTNGPQPPSGRAAVAQAVVTGTLGHAAVDTVFYTAAGAATALGWTWFGTLAVVHLALDVIVWGMTLRPLALYLQGKPSDRSLNGRNRLCHSCQDDYGRDKFNEKGRIAIAQR